MTQPSIGFIGLGLMGSAMVERLQSKGYALSVIANRSREHVDMAVARGAAEVASAKDIAQRSDVVMLCMSTSEQVETRMRGTDGVIAGLNENSVVIDFGTSLPASTQVLAEEVTQAGSEYLDAPLGRTPGHARQGQLNIMAAGNRAAFDKVEPVLNDLGENVFYLGRSGTGHTIKLLNNFFGMTVANTMCEVFAMADKMNVPRQQVYEVMSAGPLHSGMMDFVKGYAIDGDPDQLAFAVKNAAKDVGYYSEMSAASGAVSCIAPCLLAALDEAVENNRGEDMVSQLVDFYAQKF